jgi:hypothetical protein
MLCTAAALLSTLTSHCQAGFCMADVPLIAASLANTHQLRMATVL